MIILNLISAFILTYFTGCVSGNFFVCDNQEECIAPDATCTDNICKCPVGKTLSLDGTECLNVVLSYGGACTDDNQCAPLLGKYICKTNTCQCDTGYRYYHGNCIKAANLGDSCERSEDCFVSPDLFAMICSDSKCACNVGYYPRGDFDCRPLAKEYGDVCAMDSDCQNLPDAICNNGCVKKQESESLIAKKSLKTNDNDRERSSRNVITAYADNTNCDNNEDCSEVNTYCSPITKTCVCKKGYFLHATKGCVGELGMNVDCQVDSDCVTTPRKCQDGMCICPITHFYKPGLNGCSKAANKVGDGKIACVNDLDCNVFGPLASCVAENNLDSFCQCYFGAQLNDDSICVQETECKPDCVQDSDCTIINSVCDKQAGECICPDGYRLEENTCSPNLGSKCNDDTLPCLLENSKCDLEEENSDKDKICLCKENHVQIDDMTCLEGKNLFEDCENSLQCMWSNTECKSKNCTCKNNYILVGDLCILAREMGDYCTNAQQCQKTLGNDVLCRNSKCQCPTGFRTTEDRKGCTSHGFNIHSKSYLSLLLVVFIFYFVRM